MTAGADQNMAFRIIVDTLGIAVTRGARSFTKLLNKYIQANWQLLVIAAQAAILFRITGQGTARY
ncbi:MAG TPA: hypothetical protein DCO71_05595 [Gammaproteobacteria bacterium]|nr:hypothetical protein [Gammaproteobacteria bacterium]